MSLQTARGVLQGRTPAAAATKVLQIHVSHACNLTCESCSHFSNQHHKGNLELSYAEEWMSAWSSRIDVQEFTLLGGEPTIHPRLADFIPMTRKHWPRARILVVTNGFFLHRHPMLPEVMIDSGNCQLVLSLHHDSPEYLSRVRPVLSLVEDWKTRLGLRVDIRASHTRWTRRYIGLGDDVAPYEDANPRASWEICPARICRQLFEGKLWKCSPIAYLQLQNQKYELSNKWAPYLRYTPLGPDCSDSELQLFLAREEESICSMCPAERRLFEPPSPLAHG